MRNGPPQSEEWHAFKIVTYSTSGTHRRNMSSAPNLKSSGSSLK